MSRIINLFGGPGIGKSSIASGLTYEIKRKHISCDSPYEFPKQLAWDENYQAIKDQLYVLANQHRGIVKSFGKVDYIILDSPIILSLVYKSVYEGLEYPASLYTESFDKMVLDIHNQYDSVNILLKRSSGVHNDKERYQTISESIELDNKIENTLLKHNIPYHTIPVSDTILIDILKLLDIS